MATIGQQLLQPESGWQRIDDTNSNISKTTFNTLSSGSAYGSSYSEFKEGTLSEATFNFVGTKLRIISVVNTSAYRAPKISIFIDGVEEQYTEVASGVIWKCLVYEKVGLENKEHFVKIKGLSIQAGATFYLDAIDIDSNGEIKPYKEIKPLKKMIIKNLTKDTQYSLSDRTLIHLPDNTTESIIEYGIEKGEYIQLDVPFTKHRYFNDTPVANASGKVFTHDIGKINTLSIKELREEGVVSIVLPNDVWYETNMTSNTAPTPLVASASSTYTSFSPYKAFNGTRGTTGNDSWMTSNSRTGWIQIDFGKGVIANRVNISIVSNLTAAPKNFNILGSKDGVNFVILGAFTNQTNWTANELREYSFNNNEKFSYYKVEILENNGHGTDVSIGGIQYGFKREEI